MVGTVCTSARLPVVCCVLLTAAAAVAGCARVVTGAAQAGDLPVPPARPLPVADLLIEPTRFPTRYVAAVVPSKDVDRVIAEIDGVAAGSEVTPPECAPLPMLADQRAAAQGVDEQTGARLTVTVIRPVPSVRVRVTQLADCPSFTSAAADSDEVSKVTVKLPPAPPVDADDSYAVDQTVTPTSAGDPDTRTLTLVALVEDVRVSASWQQHGGTDDSPDTEALDALFTDAVLKVRREMPR